MLIPCYWKCRSWRWVEGIVILALTLSENKKGDFEICGSDDSVMGFFSFFRSHASQLPLMDLLTYDNYWTWKQTFMFIWNPKYWWSASMVRSMHFLRSSKFTVNWGSKGVKAIKRRDRMSDKEKTWAHGQRDKGERFTRTWRQRLHLVKSFSSRHSPKGFDLIWFLMVCMGRI